MQEQAIASIPSDYKGLREIVRECEEQRRFNEKLMKVFDTEDVQRRLGSMMDSTIKVLEWISKYYQQQRHSQWGTISVMCLTNRPTRILPGRH